MDNITGDCFNVFLTHSVVVMHILHSVVVMYILLLSCASADTNK